MYTLFVQFAKVKKVSLFNKMPLELHVELLKSDRLLEWHHFRHENYGHQGEISDIRDRVKSWMVQADLSFTTNMYQ